jgi:hypothetical protein
MGKKITWTFLNTASGSTCNCNNSYDLNHTESEGKEPLGQTNFSIVATQSVSVGWVNGEGRGGASFII